MRGTDEGVMIIPLSIVPLRYQSHFVLPCGVESISGTLVYGESNVWPRMSAEIQQHSNNYGVIEVFCCRGTIYVVREIGLASTGVLIAVEY